jgi:hypothetical protein
MVKKASLVKNAKPQYPAWSIPADPLFSAKSANQRNAGLSKQ